MTGTQGTSRPAAAATALLPPARLLDELRQLGAVRCEEALAALLDRERPSGRLFRALPVIEFKEKTLRLLDFAPLGDAHQRLVLEAARGTLFRRLSVQRCRVLDSKGLGRLLGTRLFGAADLHGLRALDVRGCSALADVSSSSGCLESLSTPQWSQLPTQHLGGAASTP